MFFSEVVDSGTRNAAINKLAQVNVKIASMLHSCAQSDSTAWNPLFLVTQPAFTVVPAMTMTFRPDDMGQLAQPTPDKVQQVLLEVDEAAKQRTAVWPHLFLVSVLQGGFGVIVPSSPTLWASRTASYQRDVHLETFGSVADRFDAFELRVSGELGSVRERLRSLEEGSMQSSREGSMPSSLHSSLQTSPAATRQSSSSAQSLFAHTVRSGVDALPEPGEYVSNHCACFWRCTGAYCICAAHPHVEQHVLR